jgi:hypothetical protein
MNAESRSAAPVCAVSTPVPVSGPVLHFNAEICDWTGPLPMGREIREKFGTVQSRSARGLQPERWDDRDQRMAGRELPGCDCRDSIGAALAATRDGAEWMPGDRHLFSATRHFTCLLAVRSSADASMKNCLRGAPRALRRRIAGEIVGSEWEPANRIAALAADGPDSRGDYNGLQATTTFRWRAASTMFKPRGGRRL